MARPMWSSASGPERRLLKAPPILPGHRKSAISLIWDVNCRNNLANFLPRRTDKVAVVAKGCDARNIVNHVVENQIARDQVYIIGVPCEGMIDPALVVRPGGPRGSPRLQVERRLPWSSRDRDYTTELDLSEVLRQNCTVCAHRNPPVYDELVREAVPELDGIDRYADLRELL